MSQELHSHTLAITITALKVKRKESEFDLFKDLVLALDHNNARLHEGDVIVVSSKYVALSEGRTIRESDLCASKEARILARRFKMREGLAEAVLRESEEVVSGVAGFAMAVTGGILAPNAGIDKSNSHAGDIILYPFEPNATAKHIHRKAFLQYGINIGVVIADSRLMPMRAGTSGIAIASAGIEPVDDLRGELDIDGRPLVVTKRAVSDSIATMANHAMGEADESTPFVLVRGAQARITGDKSVQEQPNVKADECVYARAMTRRD